MSERTCPHCQMIIYDDDALLCHQCGGSLRKSSGGAMGFFNGSGMKVIVAVIVVIIAVSFLMTMF